PFELKFQPHEMLFGFVARKDDDLGGFAHFAGQQAADQYLPERAGAARNQYTFSFQWLQHLFTSSFYRELDRWRVVRPVPATTGTRNPSPAGTFRRSGCGCRRNSLPA